MFWGRNSSDTPADVNQEEVIVESPEATEAAEEVAATPAAEVEEVEASPPPEKKGKKDNGFVPRGRLNEVLGERRQLKAGYAKLESRYAELESRYAELEQRLATKPAGTTTDNEDTWEEDSSYDLKKAVSFIEKMERDSVKQEHDRLANQMLENISRINKDRGGNAELQKARQYAIIQAISKNPDITEEEAADSFDEAMSRLVGPINKPAPNPPPVSVKPKQKPGYTDSVSSTLGATPKQKTRSFWN